MSVRKERGHVSTAVAVSLSTLVLGMTGATAQEIPRRDSTPDLRRDAPWDAGGQTKPGTPEDVRYRPWTPRWTITPRGAVDLTYTDNVLLTANNRRSDFIITPTAGLTASGSGSRSGLTADIELNYDAYTRTSSLNGFRYKALTSGYVGTSDQSLILRGRIATDLQQSSTEDVAPATERSFGRNQVQILNYGIGPTYRHDISRNVEMQASYDFASVTYLDPPVGPSNFSFSDSHRHTGTLELSNTDRGGAFDWSALGSYEQTVGTRTSSSSRRANGEAYGRYKVSSSFAVLARAGYDWIDEPTLSGDFSSPYVRAGFQWAPTPRLDLRMEAGYRYNRPNFEGELSYSRAEWLIVHASYRQGIETPQRINSRNLADISRLIADVPNLPLDPITGLPPDPNGSGFNISNQAFRNSRAEAGVRGRFGRNTYSISGYYEERKANSVKGTSKGVDAELSRRLTPLLTASIEAGYAKTDNPRLIAGPTSRTETYRGTVKLAYQLTETTSTSIRYVYLQRKTTFVFYHENAGVLNLTKTF